MVFNLLNIFQSGRRERASNLSCLLLDLLLCSRGIQRTHIRTTFFTLKFSSGVTSGSWPLSFCKTICWTIRSNSSQYCTVLPLLLSEERKREMEGQRQGGVVWAPISLLVSSGFCSPQCGWQGICLSIWDTAHQILMNLQRMMSHHYFLGCSELCWLTKGDCYNYRSKQHDNKWHAIHFLVCSNLLIHTHIKTLQLGSFPILFKIWG